MSFLRMNIKHSKMLPTIAKRYISSPKFYFMYLYLCKSISDDLHLVSSNQDQMYRLRAELQIWR